MRQDRSADYEVFGDCQRLIEQCVPKYTRRSLDSQLSVHFGFVGNTQPVHSAQPIDCAVLIHCAVSRDCAIATHRAIAAYSHILAHSAASTYRAVAIHNTVLLHAKVTNSTLAIHSAVLQHTLIFCRVFSIRDAVSLCQQVLFDNNVADKALVTAHSVLFGALKAVIALFSAAGLL